MTFKPLQMIHLGAFNMSNAMWLFGLALLAVTSFYLALNKSQRAVFANRIKTPPPPSEPVTGPVPPLSYKDVIPPLRREALAEVSGSFSRDNIAEVSEEDVKSLILPMTADYRISERKTYTPTGFSPEEIMGIGDFPDYAALSGVPLPQPYREFDIGRALPRPYRPFRWAYHQTMCMFAHAPLFGQPWIYELNLNALSQP
jgi:hypothetical protein